MTVTAAIETITVEDAEEYLSKNKGNRKLRRAVVERYARDIKGGSWHVTGDAIRFNGDGTLLDGQHRLAAVIKAKTPVSTLVIRGLGHDSRHFMDTGQKRSFADILRFRGLKNNTQLAALVTWVWRYENGEMLNRNVATNSELLEILDNNPELIESTAWIANHGTSFRGSRTGLSALHYYTNKTMPGECEAFFIQLRDGENLRKGNPIFALRRYLETLQNTVGPRMGAPVVVHGVIIKGWNAHIEGRELIQLRFAPTGRLAEDFPTITTRYPGEVAE